MDVRIVAQEFSLTASLREYLHRRLGFAFAWARHHMPRIVIRLRDLNGPRGGRDKLCQVSVQIPGLPGHVVRDVQEDMYAAIDRAIKRAAHSAARTAARKQILPREKAAATRIRTMHGLEVNHV